MYNLVGFFFCKYMKLHNHHHNRTFECWFCYHSKNKFHAYLQSFPFQLPVPRNRPSIFHFYRFPFLDISQRNVIFLTSHKMWSLGSESCSHSMFLRLIHVEACVSTLFLFTGKLMLTVWMGMCTQCCVLPWFLPYQDILGSSCTSCPSLGISHFSKEPWLFVPEKVI